MTGTASNTASRAARWRWPGRGAVAPSSSSSSARARATTSGMASPARREQALAGALSQRHQPHGRAGRRLRPRERVADQRHRRRDGEARGRQREHRGVRDVVAVAPARPPSATPMPTSARASAAPSWRSSARISRVGRLARSHTAPALDAREVVRAPRLHQPLQHGQVQRRQAVVAADPAPTRSPSPRRVTHPDATACSSPCEYANAPIGSAGLHSCSSRVSATPPSAETPSMPVSRVWTGWTVFSGHADALRCRWLPGGSRPPRARTARRACRPPAPGPRPCRPARGRVRRRASPGRPAPGCGGCPGDRRRAPAAAPSPARASDSVWAAARTVTTSFRPDRAGDRRRAARSRAAAAAPPRGRRPAARASGCGGGPRTASSTPRRRPRRCSAAGRRSSSISWVNLSMLVGPPRPQNRKYRCASGSVVAGSQVRSSPSARTS